MKYENPQKDLGHQAFLAKISGFEEILLIGSKIFSGIVLSNFDLKLCLRKSLK
jgi:hypothetical protein